MEYIVYRYIDLEDEIIKYIGITKRKIKLRIEEHKKNEEWTKDKKWRIDYFVVKNKSLSEAWESHLIALYKTYNWYNKAKKDWGIIPEFLKQENDWILYSLNDTIIDIQPKRYSLLNDENLIGLVSISELSEIFNITIDDLLLLSKKRVIQPLARNKRNELLYYEIDIEYLKNYLDKSIY